MEESLKGSPQAQMRERDWIQRGPGRDTYKVDGGGG